MKKYVYLEDLSFYPTRIFETFVIDGNYFLTSPFNISFSLFYVKNRYMDGEILTYKKISI